MSGSLYLVSVGPGDCKQITEAAKQAVLESEIIIAYDLYLTWIKEWLEDKEIISLPLTQEKERALQAIKYAREGNKVALLSSGDIGIYGMAAFIFAEMSEEDKFALQVIPGVSAANACASLLGAPLAHDFATLSLSDLLCPWEIIEQRAHALAQADLVTVLYNVQSKKRRDGVYKILDIMLQHKKADTLCAMVSNAYRPEAKKKILTLAELRQKEFNMFTTIIIGNQYSRTKQEFFYTARTIPEDEEKEYATIPDNAIWIFTGTSDGNLLARRFIDKGYRVVISTATAYGAGLALENCPEAFVLSGKLGQDKREEILADKKAKIIVDATHPYADKISVQLMEVAARLNIPYLRYERPGLADTESKMICSSMDEASKLAISLGKRIFLSTGSTNLNFLSQPEATGKEWFIRLTPQAESINAALAAGIPQTNIFAMQGPFSQEMNETLWRNWQIDCVITKDSGEEGGFRAKILAAGALNIPLIVVARPQLNYPNITSTIETALAEVDKLGVL